MLSLWLIIALAVMLIGVTKSGFGSGLGLIVVPITALTMSHIPGFSNASALPFLLPLLITGDLMAIWQYRKFAKYDLILRMIPGTIVGIALGTLLIIWFKGQKPQLAALLINLEIGLESIILVSLHWWRLYKGEQARLMPEPYRVLATTGFAGISSTLAHAAGPVIAMYLLPMKLARQVQVSTSATYFFFTNCAKIPAFIFTGLFSQVNPLFSLQFAPFVIGGAIAGLWINKRISDKAFSRVVYVAVFCLGWYITIDNAIGLWLYERHS